MKRRASQENAKTAHVRVAPSRLSLQSLIRHDWQPRALKVVGLSSAQSKTRVIGRTKQRFGERGFTMVEMLAAIVIIALLAALATPSFIAMVRDRRVVRAGLQIAETFREARTRSLSRGVAVTVQWDGAASAKGILRTREALIVAAGQGLTKTCLTADWSAASTDTRPLSAHNFEQGIYELAQIKLVDTGGSDQTFGEVCFAPDGTSHVRFSNAGAFVPLTGVPSFKVKNTKTNVERIVFVPPNGIARFAL